MKKGVFRSNWAWRDHGKCKTRDVPWLFGVAYSGVKLRVCLFFLRDSTRCGPSGRLPADQPKLLTFHNVCHYNLMGPERTLIMGQCLLSTKSDNSALSQYPGILNDLGAKSTGCSTGSVTSHALPAATRTQSNQWPCWTRIRSHLRKQNQKKKKITSHFSMATL